MSDTPSGTPGSAPQIPVAVQHNPFPVARLLYSILYGFIAWMVLHILFFIGAIQFVVFAINGRVNEELKSFASTLFQYESELLAYICFVREELPFPFGPLPKHA
ncbi:MAG: DUF4389 domain-containing protein [Alphaproteobacteria bacterium]|nr:DUF4389 domain-containing protein [Alphaproteobacteria bacterium]